MVYVFSLEVISMTSNICFEISFEAHVRNACVLAKWFSSIYVLNINFETKVDIINTIWKITTGLLAMWPKSWDFNVANFLWLLGVGLACSWHCHCLFCDQVLYSETSQRTFFLELYSSWLRAWATGNPLLKDTSEILQRIYFDLPNSCLAAPISWYAVVLFLQERGCMRAVLS